VKKLAALILALGLTTSSVMADTCQHTVASTGNTITTGSVEASNLNPVFANVGLASGPFAFISGESSGTAFYWTMATNLVLQGTVVNTFNGSTGFAGIPIGGFSVECQPYNANFIGVGGYQYTTETNGIAGGTITFSEYKPTGAAVVIGTLVLPTSPHGGPYVNTATSVLANPYTPTSGSIIGAQVTTLNTTPTNGYSGCQVTTNLT
jgi:hypothetical protein